MDSTTEANLKGPYAGITTCRITVFSWFNLRVSKGRAQQSNVSSLRNCLFLSDTLEDKVQQRVIIKPSSKLQVRASGNDLSGHIMTGGSPTCVHGAVLNPLTPSGHYMYHKQFNIRQSYVLPTQCIYVFCVDLRTNGDYFPTQH